MKKSFTPPVMQSWRSRCQWRRPVWFAVLYVVLSCLWIFLTDKLIGYFSLTVAVVVFLSIVKGFLYVAISGSLIYVILRRLEKMNNDLESIVASRTAALAASEEESRTRAEWLRRLLLPDVAWTSAEDGRTVFITPNVEDVFGFSVEEMCAKGREWWSSRIHPDERQRIVDGLRVLFSRGERFDEEYRVQCKDGHWVWVHDRAVRTHSEDGVMFADGILSDITQRKTAEQALRNAEQKYRGIFENAVLGIFQARDGTFLSVNPALAKMAGYDSPQDFLSNVHRTTDVYADLSCREELLQLMTTHGAVRDFELELKGKDGKRRTASLNVRAVMDDEGNFYHEGTVQDITARKQAEKEREESNKRYRLLFERNLAGVFRAEAGGKMLDCNPALARMLGYDSVEELLGRKSTEMLYDPGKESALLERLNKGGDINNVEIRLKRSDGTILWGLHSICLLEGANGQPPVIEGTVVDVSERRQAVEALRQQLSLMQAITSTAPDGLFMLDAEGRLTFMNPAAEQMYGYTKSELQGKVLHDICHYKRQDGAPLAASDCTISRAYMAGETLRSYEDVNFRKDGTAFDVSCSVAPLLEDGKVVGSVHVVQDITRRKRAEERYQALQEQFLHAQKMEAVGRLAGGVAHDFNNLLQVINGYSSLIMEANGSDPQLAKRARAIKEAGTRAAHLTRQLLDFSRQEASEPQIISVDRALKRALSMVRTLIGEDIDVTTHMGTNGTCIKIDAGQFEQLIMNLVVNARDAMPQGGHLHIESACVQLDDVARSSFGNISPGAYVQLSISDTGCGMETATIQHAFEPFFTTKERGKGTGLGLSIVYGIATRNGGAVRIDSSPGVGTTLHICLPTVAARVSLEEIQEHVTLPRGTESVLLAEDEKDVRVLISDQLRRLGYNVMEAGNGEEALQLAKVGSRPIDLLISDIIMPKMGGQELSNRILEICSNIKILHMSGYTDTPQPPEQKYPEIKRLQKPFTLEALATTVRQVLDH